MRLQKGGESKESMNIFERYVSLIPLPRDPLLRANGESTKGSWGAVVVAARGPHWPQPQRCRQRCPRRKRGRDALHAAVSRHTASYRYRLGSHGESCREPCHVASPRRVAQYCIIACVLCRAMVWWIMNIVSKQHGMTRTTYTVYIVCR